LLQNAPADVVKVMHDVCFSSVVGIILQSDDHSELQVTSEIAPLKSSMPSVDKMFTLSHDKHFSLTL